MTQAVPLLSVRGMIKRYGEATVLDGVYRSPALAGIQG